MTTTLPDPAALVAEAVDIDTLRPHPDNPRNGDTEAIEESLQVNGQFKPIVIASDGTILAGNHTYAAAMALGWRTISAVRLPLDPHSPEARRVMVADNRTSDLGRYDDAQLAALLQTLSDDSGLDGTGYSNDDLEDLLALEAYRARSGFGITQTDSAGAQHAAMSTGSVTDTPLPDRAAGFFAQDTRSLIMPLSHTDYAEAVELLEAARRRADVDSNAAAFLCAMRAYVQ